MNKITKLLTLKSVPQRVLLRPILKPFSMHLELKIWHRMGPFRRHIPPQPAPFFFVLPTCGECPMKGEHVQQWLFDLKVKCDSPT